MVKIKPIESKKNCFEKVHVKRVKRQATESETIFSNYISDKGLEWTIYKEPSKLNS